MSNFEISANYRDEFVSLVRAGSSNRDFHDIDDTTYIESIQSSSVSDAYIERELTRVALHSRNLCPTLVDHIGRAERILDVGCGSGGTTVALALSDLRPREVIGIDANERVLEAARVRALGYGLGPDCVRFVHNPVGQSIDQSDGSFDLATCVSVLEFIGTDESRTQFVAELVRLVRPGGYVFLATPTPFRLREHHSRRLLGNLRGRPGRAWSSPGWAIRAMFKDCDFIPLHGYRMRRHPKLAPLAPIAPAVGWLFPWQQYLVRKR